MLLHVLRPSRPFPNTLRYPYYGDNYSTKKKNDGVCVRRMLLYRANYQGRCISQWDAATSSLYTCMLEPLNGRHCCRTTWMLTRQLLTAFWWNAEVAHKYHRHTWQHICIHSQCLCSSGLVSPFQKVLTYTFLVQDFTVNKMKPLRVFESLVQAS